MIVLVAVLNVNGANAAIDGEHARELVRGYRVGGAVLKREVRQCERIQVCGQLAARVDDELSGVVAIARDECGACRTELAVDVDLVGGVIGRRAKCHYAAGTDRHGAAGVDRDRLVGTDHDRHVGIDDQRATRSDGEPRVKEILRRGAGAWATAASSSVPLVIVSPLSWVRP